MKELSVDPSKVLRTDPLYYVDLARGRIEPSVRMGRAEPIYILEMDNNLYLGFSGTKRVTYARELKVPLAALLIECEGDLYTAQQKENRKFPNDLPLTCESVKRYLINRAMIIEGPSFELALHRD